MINMYRCHIMLQTLCQLFLRIAYQIKPCQNLLFISDPFMKYRISFMQALDILDGTGILLPV